MSLLFSATLLIGALLTFWLIIRKIRKAEVTIADSTFWFLFALSLVLMGVFRQIPFFFADVFGIESPANFVFVYVIAVLVIREFYITVECRNCARRCATWCKTRRSQKRPCALNRLTRRKRDSRGAFDH